MRRFLLITVAAMSVVLALVVGLILSMSPPGSPGGGTGCGAGNIDVEKIKKQGLTAGPYGTERLVNAGHVANAATAMGLGQAGQLLGIQAAIGESTLDNINYGDYETSGVLNPNGTPTSSIGLFQQQDWWGSPEQRMDPFTAATLFFTALVQQVPNWDQMEATYAIHEVQGNLVPTHYNEYKADAQMVFQAIQSAAGAGDCAISADAQQLAQQLVQYIDSGAIEPLAGEPEHMNQIRDMATGTPKPDCAIDVRILQVITVAVQEFGSIGISDINRKCTGQIAGAGVNSPHYMNGGGRAVDFWRLGDIVTTGGDANSLQLIGILDPVMPNGAQLGQDQCRPPMALANFVGIFDRCHHLHIDVGHTDEPLRIDQAAPRAGQ